MLVYVNQQINPDPVPEPRALWLLVSGLIGVVAVRRVRTTVR